MSFKVVVQAEAEQDLTSILDHVSRDSRLNAERLLDRLEDSLQALSTRALQYPVVDRYRALGIRRRPVGAYNIYYRLRADVVEVLHVLHAARDADRLFGAD